MFGYTLPKSHLLKSNSDFQRVYDHGRRFFGQGFSIIIVPNAMEHSRLGVSVRKKTGIAVRRNRIKRLIRELFRLNRGDFPPASDIVFTVRPGFTLDSVAALRDAALSCLACEAKGRKAL